MSDASFEELHAFAAAAGIPERGFHGDHYDVPEEWFDEMVERGAVVVESRELVRRLRATGLRRRPGWPPVDVPALQLAPSPNVT